MKLFILFCCGVGVGYFCPNPVPGLLILAGASALVVDFVWESTDHFCRSRFPHQL